MYSSGAWLLVSHSPGAWEDGSTGTAPYAQAVKAQIYMTYKQHLSDESTSPEEEAGIRTGATTGARTLIYGNTIYDTLGPVSIEQGSEADVYDNTIHGSSSIGIFFKDNTDAKVYNNLVYDCNINVRFDALEDNTNNREYDIYNNKLYNPDGIGDHTFFHFNSGTSSPSIFPKIYFYHNSFAGGRSALMPSPNADGHNGLRGMRLINNIFSVDNFWNANGSNLYYDASGSRK